MDVCACASPVAGDMVDHTHNDWHCSTAEITNHYYAEGDEEHLRPSPQHIQTDRYRQTHTHTPYIPPHEEVLRAEFHLLFLAFWLLCLQSLTAKRKITSYKIKVLGRIRTQSNGERIILQNN